MRVYLDNAASTPLVPEVLEAMMPYLQGHFGNPSSIHAHGREARAAIERARKVVAGVLNTSTSEIFFTSGGTEANNTAIISAVRTHQLTHIITSAIEHHAVLHTAEALAKSDEVKVSYCKLTPKGEIDVAHLEELLAANERSFVTLMHGNNEIGNITDIAAISKLCKPYNAIFHSDTVQTMGHYPFDLQTQMPDFIVASAHKFHGPKGVGFLYINAATKIQPFMYGGGQERNMRGGTENVYGIIGLAKALEISYASLSQDRMYIEGLKNRMIEGLRALIPTVRFNGLSDQNDQGLYTVLSVSIPGLDMEDMLLFSLDIHNISASAGSACTSGTNIGSHVLQAIQADTEAAHVRFSFSKLNTADEIDYVLEMLKKVVN